MVVAPDAPGPLLVMALRHEPWAYPAPIDWGDFASTIWDPTSPRWMLVEAMLLAEAGRVSLDFGLWPHVINACLEGGIDRARLTAERAALIQFLRWRAVAWIRHLSGLRVPLLERAAARRLRNQRTPAENFFMDVERRLAGALTRTIDDAAHAASEMLSGTGAAASPVRMRDAYRQQIRNPAAPNLARTASGTVLLPSPATLARLRWHNLEPAMTLDLHGLLPPNLRYLARMAVTYMDQDHLPRIKPPVVNPSLVVFETP